MRLGEPIRVLLVDDHHVVRKGLRALLEGIPGFEVVAEAGDGQQAVTQACEHDPDVILMDLAMPQTDGLEAIVQIKERKPEARILVLTSFSDDRRILSAIKAGALGYLLKDSSPEELLDAIRAIHRGESTLPPAIASRVVQELSQAPQPANPDPLTEREKTVLKLLATGMSNLDISENLSISERTVATHVSNVLGKLHLANRTQAALFALRRGLATLKEKPLSQHGQPYHSEAAGD